MYLYRSVETCFLELPFTASYSKINVHVILSTQFFLALSMEYDQFFNLCPALRYDIAAWIILTSVLCPWRPLGSYLIWQLFHLSECEVILSNRSNH